MNIKTLARVALLVGVILSILFMGNTLYAQKLKIGYINSQKILTSYKEAIDVQKKLDELNSQWEKEAMDMQKELRELQEQYESQSLLLSEEKKAEKSQEIQNLYIKFQQFQQEKWAAPNGEIYKKQNELMEPVIAKINAAIKKLGEAEKFDYIFDTVAGNILYASDDQPDLTDKVLEELNKGVAVKSGESGKP